MLTFEWDSRKAAGNLKKHGVAFQEAATAFADPISLSVRDPRHPDQEYRFVLLGMSSLARLLIVVHREHGDTLRIISAQPVTAS